MTIFIVGAAMFVVGTVLNAAGWSLHRKTIGEAPPELFEWFVEVVRHWFALLTGRDSTTGERLAAFGAIVSALGIVVMVVGTVAWAQA